APAKQRDGVGGKLLKQLQQMNIKPMLVGTWPPPLGQSVFTSATASRWCRRNARLRCSSPTGPFRSGRSKPRSCSPIRRTAASAVRPTAAPALESIVHAGGEILNVAGARAHEIIFGEHRPVRREHLFTAAAKRPAVIVGRTLADLRASEVENGHAGIGPGRAALRIDEDIRLKEKAFTRRQRIEPIGAGVGASGRKAGAAAQIGAIEHVANAKHPLVELDIAADLAAAGNASRVCRERSTEGVALVDFGPGTAEVGAGVTAAPIRKCRWQKSGRQVSGSRRRKPQICCESVTGSERNGRGA